MDGRVDAPLESRTIPGLRTRPDSPLVSIVAPCRDDGSKIELLMPAIDAALPGVRLEVVFVHDGGSDDTLAKIHALSLRDPRVRLVNLTRSFGWDAATTAGLDIANGDVVATLRIDRGDPPEVVPKLIERWRMGYDVVVAEPTGRGRSDAGALRLLDRRAVDAASRFSERVRRIGDVLDAIGFPSSRVFYDARPDARATTDTNPLTRLRRWMNAAFGRSPAPLRAIAFAGAAVAVLSCAIGAFLLVGALVSGPAAPAWAPPLIATLFLGGVQLISLGVVSEYLARMFVETQARPLYIVEGVYGDPPV